MDDNYLIPSSTLSGIADAIREKGGTTDVIATEDMAAAIAAIEAGGGNVQYFTLPIGRSRGDVDGDGLLTLQDKSVLLRHVSGVSTLTDEVAIWCADTTGNGSIDSDDATVISQYFSRSADSIAHADYFGNWTYYKDAAFNGYYYIDVPIEGMTATTTVTLLMESHAENVTEVIPGDNSIQIRATTCPGKEVTCCLVLDENEIKFDSAPVMDKTRNKGTILVTNANNKPAYYFSKNHKSGTAIPKGGELSDSLEAGDVYVIMATYAIFSSINVGTGLSLMLHGTLPTIYFGDYSSPADTYDVLYVFNVDLGAENTIALR